MPYADALSIKRPTRAWRRYFPLLVILLGACVGAAIWNWPAEEPVRGNRVIAAWIAFFLTILLLLFWLILLSGWSWLSRILALVAIPAAIAGLFVAVVNRVIFDGDMAPQRVIFRWEVSPEDLLEDYLSTPAAAPPLGPIEALKETDFPEFRNRKRDGVVVGPPLSTNWKTKPPKKLWQHPVGGGYAGFVIAGNALVTIEQRKENEAIVCYDTTTGTERWTYQYAAHFSEPQGGDGPRATPTISDGKVYSLGAMGLLTCLDLATGKEVWKTDILDGNKNLPWAMAGSPLVYDRFVVVNPGVQSPESEGESLIAYDRATGKAVWHAGNNQAGYSSPQLATIAGKKQILLLDSAALGSFDPETGKQLWEFPWPTFNGINVSQPLVLSGDRVFVASGYGTGSALLQVTEKDGKWNAEQLWKSKVMQCKFTSPVLHKDHVYGLDDGILACVDPQTGKRLWKDGRYGHGQVLLTGDLLLISAEDGRLVLVEANPKGLMEVASMNVFDKGWRSWNTPALSDGIAYLRNDAEMACFDLRP